MTPFDNASNPMPDVAKTEFTQPSAALAWVGMEHMAMPLTLAEADASSAAARVSAWVNLPQRHVRGIHMSRLYACVAAVLEGDPLSPASLRQMLDGFLASHAGLSDHARVQIDFDLLLKRSALKSDRRGWVAYPISVCASLHQGHCVIEVEASVGYSSTCPASAALSRQLIEQRFAADFADSPTPERGEVMRWLASERGMRATPHSQRSAAKVRVRLQAADILPLRQLIDRIEAAVQTPLQAAVKREDEQAFAELNGGNLMFCEDAARRIHAVLDSDARFADFHIRAAHFESLHPHDAVAVAVKGIADGYHG